MANHMIIGLGGTGGNIIKSFRKRIYEEFRTNAVNEKLSDLHISYLWVDSSTKDLEEKQSWQTLGKNVALNEGDKVKINAAASTILDKIDSYPGINAWIGDKKVWGNIIGGITDEAGGQRRRLGRLLFAWNISEFMARLKLHVNRLQEEGHLSEVVFHICAGLAGGTGSGCIIDVISQIRSIYTDCKIILYLKLPETGTEPPANWASKLGYYRPNGYAALLELNALSVKAYCPYDLQGRKDSEDQVMRLLKDRGIDAFDSAYVYSNVNMNNNVLGVANGKLFDVVADFLFHKIVASRLVGSTTIQCVEQNENGTSAPEDGKRSKRFVSFGIGRIEYPEQEIREYIRYNFEQQALLQFKYNSWSDDFGFMVKPEEQIGTGYSSELRDDSNGKFPRWKLDDKHLTLSKKIIDDKDDTRNRWFEFDEDWKRISDFIKIVKEKDKSQWINELDRLCRERYEETFRNVGVQRFFRNQREESAGYASYIRGLVERDLFEEWENGTKSIVEIEKYLNILIDVNDTRIDRFGTVLQDKRKSRNDVDSKINDNKDAWNKASNFSKLLGKRERILNERCDLLKVKYALMTEEEGYEYASNLLRQVNMQLMNLRDIVSSIKRLINDSLERIEVDINSRCRTDDNGMTDVVTFKMYDPVQVRDNTKNIMKDSRTNKDNVLNVRRRLIAEIHNDTPDFFLFKERFNMSAFRNVFEAVCEESALNVMDKVQQDNRSGKVNILQRISVEYGHDETKLGDFIKNKLSLAAVLIQNNTEEINAGTLGDRMTISYAMFVPEYENSTNFRQTFINKVKHTIGSEITILPNYKSNEIVIFSIVSGFPLRYLENTKVLSREYFSKMSDRNEEQNKLLLHTEGDGSQFPSLYADRWDDKKKTDFAPYLLVAMSLDMVKYGFRGEGRGNQRIYYIDDDRKTSLKAETFYNVVENLPEIQAREIVKNVEARLNTGEYLSKSKRNDLKNKIDSNISDMIRKECGKSEDKWNFFVDVKEMAKDILDRDSERFTD